MNQTVNLLSNRPVNQSTNGLNQCVMYFREIRYCFAFWPCGNANSILGQIGFSTNFSCELVLTNAT